VIDRNYKCLCTVTAEVSCNIFKASALLYVLIVIVTSILYYFHYYYYYYYYYKVTFVPDFRGQSPKWDLCPGLILSPI
jgi:hypothetical protein